MNTNLARPDRKTIQSFFDQITSQYDFINSFLSLGLDKYWRKKAVERALTVEAKTILDLGVGTGKSLEAFLNSGEIDFAVGCDFSVQMLRVAAKRLDEKGKLVACDFHDLPFHVETFDLITGSFMLRSVQDMELFLTEIKKVLKRKGKVIFLELTRPKNKWVWNFFYRPYLNFYLPLVGIIFSRHHGAYRFLSQSIQSFIDPAGLGALFQKAGFSVRVTRLSFGAATIIEGNLND